jgi:hypothetical protein
MTQSDTKSTELPPPGIYYNVPFANYQAWRAMNSSTLKHARKSMRRMKWAWDGNDNADSEAMKLGRAAHVCLLEPDRFPLEYVLWSGGRRSGGEWKAFEEANADREILLADDYTRCLAIRDAVLTKPLAAELLSHGLPEVSLRWDVEGVPFKARIDWLREDCFLDVKTTRTVESPWFERDAFRLGYDLQFAVYRHGLRTLLNSDRGCYLLAVEKADELDRVLMPFPSRILDDREQRMIGYVQQWKWCCERNEFPGVNEDANEMAVPPWEEPNHEPLSLTIGSDTMEM